MPPPTSPRQRLPRYATQAELSRFFAVIDCARDRTLFALVYRAGLRVGEVALLRREDVDVDRERVLVRRLKGGRWNEQPLIGGMLQLLRDHLTATQGAADEPLFPGRDGPLGRRQIQARFVRYRDTAGRSRHLTCHSLRHSIATHLLDAGLPLDFIQDHLGHQDIRSTTIYARVTDRRRAELFRQLENSPWIVHPGRDPEIVPLAPAA